MSADPQMTCSANRQAALQLIDTCLHYGVDHFFLAPGSRCTPLTLAIAEHSRAKVVQHFDERGLAFACLGYGRAVGRPGVFVCTSGTAVANALPSVVEASLDHVPLLLLTADRPPELRDAGANQTIDQLKIFGDYTRWFFDLPAPETAPDPRFLRSTVRHALHRASDGPVHLNCMFREPLAPADFDTRSDNLPSTPPDAPPEEPLELNVDVSFDWLVPSGRTLVIAGGMQPEEARAAERLAERLKCPFLADVTSGLRGLSYDLQLLRDDNPPADVIVHCGGRVVSKRWWRFVDRHPPARYLHLTRHATRLDPLHRVTQVLRGSITRLCDGAAIEATSPVDFFRDWSLGSQITRRAAEEVIDAADSITEPGVARAIAGALPNGGGLVLGNSLPIRDMDAFGWWPNDRAVRVAANRGASGIDGQIATAAGYAAGLQQPITAVVGDLAALHDLNSLQFLAGSSTPVVLIVVNNNGGGIFHFLPIATQTHAFERYFATPHGRTFGNAARMFDLAYHHPASIEQFISIYRQSLAQSHSTLIEVCTDRDENWRFHQRIEQAVRRASA